MKPPITLPPYTFIMSDHETRQLACDVADALQRTNDMVFIDDFLAPIQNAISGMLDLDWRTDMGRPIQLKPIVNTLHGETEADLIVAHEKWFIEHFGEAALGVMALARARDNRELADYAYVFRDATPKHVLAFLNSNIAKRDLMFIHLGGGTSIGGGVLELFLAASTPIDDILNRIEQIL